MPYELNKSDVQEGKLAKLLTAPHLLTYKSTGCIPTAVADQMFPCFCKGYFTKLLHRKKLDGVRIGKQFFVNYRQARDYVNPVPIVNSGRANTTDDLGLGL